MFDVKSLEKQTQIWNQDEEMHFLFVMFWRSDFMFSKPGTIFFVNVLLELDPGHFLLIVSSFAFAVTDGRQVF